MLSRGDIIQAALDELGAWEVSVWRAADDKLFGFIAEDTWDPELMLEAVEGEKDERTLAAIEAYREHFE